jgi:hypothetical protein
MTMLRARLLILLASVLMLGGIAGTASSDTGAPTGLHGFLLRADEPTRSSFSRTPAFAWAPVPGALSYQFQLSLSTTFRDNAVVWAQNDIPTPVVAPDITLPWITGNPHSLYARVRAVLADGLTAWSNAYGFDMVAPAPPTPLPSYPGVLRWTPIEGATAYQVWLVDAGKMETVTSNVLDEREFYTFHQSQSWMGSIRWRIRVLRVDSTTSSRLNSIPAAKYGPWSQTYVSTNPPFQGGALKLLGTVSDVYAAANDPNAPAHKLMPAFLWTGNTGLSGQPAELFRVEVFTDRQCLNRVFTGAVTGAPAYSPRPFGPLSLPTSGAAVASARNSFLPDGGEPAGVTIDGDTLTTTESSPDTTPTGSAPPAPGDPPGGATGGTSGGSSGSGTSGTGSSGTGSSSGSGSGAGATGGTIQWSGRAGAPIDLWDVDWPTSGYYWTVIPVVASPPSALRTAVVGAGAKSGDDTIPVANSNGFSSGDLIQIGSGTTVETRTVASVADGSVTLQTKLGFFHGAGDPVLRLSGNLEYLDTELAQDACASGRVARFGKESEPSLTASGELFATGLSSTGRLTSALHTTAFYGQPLVSWTPALGATAYEVQWGKTRYPFQPEPIPGSGNKGYMTTGTSLVLPVGPGVWYYRVRGFDYSLPSGSQQMSWSDPARLVVAKPSFKIVGGSSAPAKQKPTAPKKTTAPKTTTSMKHIIGLGVEIDVPVSWKAGTDHGIADYQNADRSMFVEILRLAKNYKDTATSYANLIRKAGDTPTVRDVMLPAGPARVVAATTHDEHGKRIVVLTYAVYDGPSLSYMVGFQATPKQYAANAKLFGRMIGSFGIGA